MLVKIDAAKGWVRSHLMGQVSPQTDLTGYAQMMTSQSKPLVAYLLSFMHEADFNVTNIQHHYRCNNGTSARRSSEDADRDTDGLISGT